MLFQVGLAQIPISLQCQAQQFVTLVGIMRDITVLTEIEFGILVQYASDL